MKITTVVTTKDGSIYWAEELWLQRHGIEYYKNVGNRAGSSIAYNIAIERFLREDRENEYLVMLDNDVGLNDEALGLWTQPGDLLYCAAPSGDGKGHYGASDLWAGCMRASRTLLEKMRDRRAPPWFHTPTNITETKMITCECRYFVVGAQQVGVESKMITTVEHLMRVLAGYDESGRLTFRRLGADKEGVNRD